MGHRKWKLIVLCLVCAVAFTGCPLTGSMVTGAWKMALDNECDSVANSQLALILLGGGQARLYADTTPAVGTWTINGSNLTIVVTDGNATLTLTAPANANTLTGTAQSNNASACWSATKAQF